MTTGQMRQYLIDSYKPNAKSQNTWAERVNKMGDAQVVAIYMRLVNKPAQQRQAS
jgi:predicted secreted protein